MRENRRGIRAYRAQSGKYYHNRRAAINAAVAPAYGWAVMYGAWIGLILSLVVVGLKG
jgi:hypothetical protein